LSDKEYLLREFRHCDTNTPAIGEASVWYLFSDVAISNIYEFNPEAKLIIMLRDPVSMVQSLHSQAVFSLDEDVKDFSTAWQLQEQRSKGLNIPKTCRNPKILQYKKIASYSEQLQRVLSYYPAEQIKVIIFEDFVQNTQLTYNETLEFIGVSKTSRLTFSKINENKKYKYKYLAKLVYRHPAWSYKLTELLRNKLGIQRLGIQKYILDNISNYINSENIKRPKLPEYIINMLRKEFSDDISLTEKVLKIDLSRWKK